jgi:hypothetical protein
VRSIVLLILLLFAAISAFAQVRPAKGLWDWGAYVSGGPSVEGGRRDTQVFNLRARVGKVLTGQHGRGFLRGNFEYAVDIVPLYLVFQQTRVYGGGFDPLVLKWNFTATRHETPYLELGGGTLFTTHEVPPGTSATNFRTHASLGLHLENGVNVEARYEHISNAGLAVPNPGINTVQLVIGISHFSCAPLPLPMFQDCGFKGFPRKQLGHP